MTPSTKLLRLSAARFVLVAALGLSCALLLAGPAPAQSGLPDLRVRSLSNPPAALAIGTRFAVREATANAGAAAAGRSTTRHYLSLDRRRSRDDLRLTGGRRVRSLRPGGRSLDVARLALPGSPAAGSYFLLACADDQQRVHETNERNNCLASRAPTFVGRVLRGRALDRANFHVPDRAFTDPAPFDVVRAGGVRLSVRDLLLNFKSRATLSAANALLASVQGEVAGGNPYTKTLLVRLTGPSSFDRLLAAERHLRASRLVAGVGTNFAVEPQRLPPRNVDIGNDRWTWELPPLGTSGNWGLKTIRMPQAWNLFDHAARTNATIEALVAEADENPSPTVTADVASWAHPDLHVDVFQGTTVSEHATMVSGLIGARWSNNAGVEGVYPRRMEIVSRGATYHGTLEDTVIRVLRAHTDVRVVNYSAGISWTVDPVTARVRPGRPAGRDNPTWREWLDGEGDRFRQALQNYATGAGGRENWLMFCSAGNLRRRPGTNQDFAARDNSACTNVAIRGGAGAGHFLAVEATDSAGNRASYSASAGTLSAPGTCVRSTEAFLAPNYDRAGCPATDTTIAGYATNSGTSFSSPIAAGLGAYLWSLDPDLTYQQVRDVLTAPANRVAVAAGALGGSAGGERIDAFAAAMGIDVLRGNKALQRRLVDVDDGSVDGNQRIDPWTSAVNGGIANQGSRRGDTRITMKDFRTFRDAYLQANAGAFATAGLLVMPDGEARHFKNDLNFDGCVGIEGAVPAHPVEVPARTNAQCGASEENVDPRYDFNGDGRIGAFPVTSPFKRDVDGANCADNADAAVIASPGCLRDVDVLVDPELWDPGEAGGYNEHVFATAVNETEFSNPEAPNWEPRRFILGNREPNGSEAPELLKTTPDYLHSFDLHLRINWDSFNPDIDKVAIRVSTQIWGQDEESFLRFVRVPRGAQRPIVTLPLWTGHAKVLWTAYDEDEPYVPSLTDVKTWTDVRFGQDRTYEISG